MDVAAKTANGKAGLSTQTHARARDSVAAAQLQSRPACLCFSCPSSRLNLPCSSGAASFPSETTPKPSCDLVVVPHVDTPAPSFAESPPKPHPLLLCLVCSRFRPSRLCLTSRLERRCPPFAFIVRLCFHLTRTLPPPFSRQPLTALYTCNIVATLCLAPPPPSPLSSHDRSSSREDSLTLTDVFLALHHFFLYSNFLPSLLYAAVSTLPSWVLQA